MMVYAPLIVGKEGKNMKGSLIILTILAFVLIPAMSFAAAKTPVEQPLVREGTLAVKLVSMLKLGTTTDEATAESLLVSAGIAPRNGWMADYPITPDIVTEVRDSISKAAESKTLAMDQATALTAFDSTMQGYGLAISAADYGTAETDQAASCPDSTVTNNYYDEGAPVVTYCTPPYDYAYLYSWVPYPFWGWGVWFPGFFVLADFDIVIDHHHHHHHGFGHFSNHFRDRARGTFARIDPARRADGGIFIGNTPRLSGSAQRSAASILSRGARMSSSTVSPGRGGTRSGTMRSSAMSGRSFTGRGTSSGRSFSSTSGATHSGFSGGRSFGGGGSFGGMHR